MGQLSEKASFFTVSGRALTWLVYFSVVFAVWCYSVSWVKHKLPAALFWGCGAMLEKHPLAFKKAVICTFHFLQRSFKSPFMWNGPCFILSVRGLLFKWMNCLEGIEGVLSPAPAFLEPLGHPGIAELRGIQCFFWTVLCMNCFSLWKSHCSEVTDPAVSVTVAVSARSCPRCPSSNVITLPVKHPCISGFF